MQMSLFLISQGSNYGYNLVDGFQSAYSQIIDFFFCIIVFLAVLEKQNQSHSNRTKKMERLI